MKRAVRLPITPDKTYYTRSGKEVRIAEIRHDRIFSVVGFVNKNGKWFPDVWTEEGLNSFDDEEDDLDIIYEEHKETR
jgi:hypothetical protein